MALKGIQLITFDVSGTLLKVKKTMGEIYGEVAKSHGIVTDYKKLSDNWYKTWKLMNKLHPNYGLYSNVGWYSWWKFFIKLTFDGAVISGGKIVPMEKTSIDLMKLFSDGHCWRPTAGCIPLLESLSSKSIPMGIISNFDPRLHKILEDTGLNRYFSFVITSYESCYLKPDASIFRLAEINYETILKKKFEKSSTIHIGDSIKYDYLGPRRVGWQSALVSEKTLEQVLEDEPSIDPSMVFKDLNQFKEYLFGKEKLK